ncbi:MAG: LacI family DNA-binding transcriptional regulator, partial [Spirochaetota bacterium]|nr:LacI family DNA-binding transcriptional regulator [Spirochaetota bacterium]
MDTTIKDIAHSAQVSYATVSRALNNKYGVNPKTRDRILKIAKDLNYSPNAIARGLVSKKSFTIGLILPDITNPYFPEIAAGIEEAANARSYSVFLCNTNNNEKRERWYLNLLSQRRVDGILMAPTGHSSERPDPHSSGDLPLVYVSNAPLQTRHSSVLIDNVRGGYIATKHLIDCGFHSMGYIGVREEDMRDNERFEGYKLALDRHGRIFEEEYCRFGDFKQESGYKLIQEMIS